MIFVLAMLTSD